MSGGLDLAFYGDDLTGSTDAMEALTLSGKPTCLYLGAPDPAAIARRPDLRAVGIAGVSRGKSPAWMDEVLPPLFRALRDTGAPLVHYKVCSTFDSAPALGNIGRAIEIGLAVFGCEVVPIVVGVPRLGRYTAFGHLFASYLEIAAIPHRIDRHPVMSVHPRTPMTEADLLRHLRGLTELPVALVDFRSVRFAAPVLPRAGAVLIDVLDAETSAAAGRLLKSFPWPRRPGFVVGSSGVEYALLDAEPTASPGPTFPRPREADRILVLSGSASATTAAQIAFAEQAGWVVLDADTCALADQRRSATEQQRLADKASTAIANGNSVVIDTARGPHDPRLRAGCDDDTAELLGTPLGRVAAAVLDRSPGLHRVILAGGDTSGAIARNLGIVSLEMIAPLVPGSPLCRAGAPSPRLDGLELVLKGGQVGGADYFERVRLGRVGPGGVQKIQQQESALT